MYHYRESGLKYVWLKSGYRYVDTPYGKGVSIVDVDGLHREIAKFLAVRKPVLTGAEFRFIRKELDLSQSKIADLIGSTEQTVSLWERKGRVPKFADRFIRLLYLEHANGNVRIRKMIEDLSELDRHQAKKVTFAEKDRGWRACA